MQSFSEISGTANEAAAWFFANSDDVFIIVRDGHAVRISPGWTELLGWSEAEAIGRPFWDFVHPDDLTVVRAAVADIKDRGWATYEHRVPMKSGDYLWMRVHAKRATDGAGIVVMQDISARRRRETEAAEVARANILLSQAAGVRLWRYDPVSGDYEYDPDFSRPFADASPERRVRLFDSTARIDPADQPTVEAALAQGALGGELTVVDFRRQADDGEWRSLRSSWIGSRKLPGGQFEIVGLTQDLTELMAERDRAVAGEEAAEAASQAKAAFLSRMSHEVRTPMNGLMGALHLAKAAVASEREALIDQALASGETLTMLLSDIVAFADSPHGRPEVDCTPISIRELLEGAVDLHRVPAQAKGVELILICDADDRLLLDGPKVRRILRVLIGNAVRFTAEGSIRVRVFLQQGDVGRQVVVEVTDTGIGIDANAQARLLQDPEAEPAAATPGVHKAGAGCATAKRLAEILSGAITCESALGQGSTFRLTLPANTVPAQAVEDPEALAPLRVLVVDDNATNRMVASQILLAFGVETETACDGVEAVEAAARTAFDVILMDIQMPVMDGVEATRRIRALPGPAGRVRIVALTANDLPHQRSLYAAAGMNGCIAKPVSPAALVAELNTCTGPQAAAA